MDDLCLWAMERFHYVNYGFFVCFIAVLVTCGCCCVPCIRALFVRLINRAVGESDTKADTMMPLLGNGESQYENIMVRDLV